MAKYVYDLKDPASSWSGTPAHSYFADGTVSSTVGSVLPADRSEHALYWVLDTVMHKIPEGTDLDKSHMPHVHRRGYETFFCDSGKLWLYLNGQKALVQKGDIVHLQAGQSHGMGFIEEVKWRGTYHDYFMAPEMTDVMRVMAAVPEAKDDPELQALNPGQDNIKMEPFIYQEVPAEQCLGIKNPSRPWAEYKLDGCTVKILVERWENGGVKELDCAVMEPGFTAEWVKYPKLREVLYVRRGKVKFNIMGEEVIADDECVVDIPRFAPHSLEVLEEAEVYDLGGQTYYSLFFQNYESLRVRDPQRFNDPAVIEALKKQYDVTIAKIGRK